MESHPKSQTSLFQVYLRLRPPPPSQQPYPSLTIPDRFLTVEEASEDAVPTHITLNPPNDNRRRAVEKFAFTQVFEEEASQLDIFQGTGVIPLVEGVLSPQGGEGRDGLLATLGVTGSGKSHTILGSKSQRGLTQLALDVLFRSISANMLDANTTPSLLSTIAASDGSEAQLMSAQGFFDTIYGDPTSRSRASSRAATPMLVRTPSIQPSLSKICASMTGRFPDSPKSIRIVEESILEDDEVKDCLTVSSTPRLPSYLSMTASRIQKNHTKTQLKGESFSSQTASRKHLYRPSPMPTMPDISAVTVPIDPSAEYAIVISMYEVYNDRIFDLLTPGSKTASSKDVRRRPLLFKPTEQSPDRKLVAGLRKVMCGSMKEALMVLEAGLQERRVAGTGSNSVSSRSHGFFCVEVKKRRKSRSVYPWSSSALTVVDLAGSERARDAKTQGATLAEAGKINESLMYLGQCLQMQSDIGNNTKPNLVPFRQCKLTELLFSNSFPSASASASTSQRPRNPQKAVMIVTADPVGDFNATSQILRYSALAREVTVPRIPSVSSTILATCQNNANKGYFNGRTTPSDTERETMEIAALEIARMSEEIDSLRAELLAEQQRRMEVEAHLMTYEDALEDKMMDFEAAIREECYQEMEKAMHEQTKKWKACLAEEQEKNEQHLDKKLEILARGLDDEPQVDNDENKENVLIVEGLEDENRRLKREMEIMRRELQLRSPSKNAKTPLRDSTPRTISDISSSFENMRVSEEGTPTSPVKKMRKLTTRKWDMGVGDDLF
ncbi:p-loop containing nucleoside triphosphate hydrolase-13 [Coleophoma crateriformis]|uniref:p-loop containing nucleoside triphosphate hydrolase-13 n=1 Tax=Coleophoma crateriformis TaxID=565419 RepID=A0A3D8R8L9_9HELO|nr:p-loop containing nucleoside triphosphate hydrolase-13 [Coleophoma crateriformis]